MFGVITWEPGRSSILFRAMFPRSRPQKGPETTKTETSMERNPTVKFAAVCKSTATKEMIYLYNNPKAGQKWLQNDGQPSRGPEFVAGL